MRILTFAILIVLFLALAALEVAVSRLASASPSLTGPAASRASRDQGVA